MIMGQVEDEALNNVVAFFTEHHVQQLLVFKLSNNLQFPLLRQDTDRFLYDSATVLIVRKLADLAHHAVVECVDMLG